MAFQPIAYVPLAAGESDSNGTKGRSSNIIARIKRVHLTTPLSRNFFHKSGLQTATRMPERSRVALLCESNRPTRALVMLFTLICAVTISAHAQTGTLSSYQDKKEDGISAGGKWMEFRSEDKMTGAKRFRFELRSGNDPREESDYEPRVELFCSRGKFQKAYFDPGAGLGPPNRPGFWGQPQIEVMVRIDNTHESHGWNWVRGRVLSMDKGTVRGLIGAKIFKVQVGTDGDSQIAEFSPAGLKLDRVKQACSLTPKKPRK